MIRYYREVIVLKTLYVDVYFFINFTVDILAISIALRLSNISLRIKRVIFSGCIGAALAFVDLFIQVNLFFEFLLALLFSIAISCCACGRISLYRHAKFISLFYISSFIISGAVTYIYGLLDKYFGEAFKEIDEGGSRRALIFSLIILLIIGVLKILIMIFTNTLNEKAVRIYIRMEDKTLELDALVDTGNLVRDPMNMSPVMFLKPVAASAIFPQQVIELSEIDKLGNGYKKRIRLVPVTKGGETHVMTGVRVDKIGIYNSSGKCEEVNATVVIDKEGGTYGGYEALMPYAAIKDVK